MKIKYIGSEGSLGFEPQGVYDVFSVEINQKNNKIKFYAKGESSFVYPLDMCDVFITDGTLKNKWSIGISNNNEVVIGPKEINEIENFWWRYYEDDLEIKSIVNSYLKEMFVKDQF